MPPFILFVLNIYPKLFLGEKINCLLPPIAELLRWEPGIVSQETAVLGVSNHALRIKRKCKKI